MSKSVFLKVETDSIDGLECLLQRLDNSENIENVTILDLLNFQQKKQLSKTAWTSQKPTGSIPLETTLRMCAIIDAMHHREKEILECLINLGGKTTQAKVYHKTRMPTTTLSRWVDSLERRGLVDTNRFGKLRRIELTEKFLKE